MKINFEQLNWELNSYHKHTIQAFQRQQHIIFSKNHLKSTRYDSQQSYRKKRHQRIQKTNNIYHKIRGSLEKCIQIAQKQTNHTVFHKNSKPSKVNHHLMKGTPTVVIKPNHQNRKEVNFQQLSGNLAKPKTQVCKKNNCKKITQRQYEKRIQEQLQGTSHNFIPKINKSSLDVNKHQIAYSAENAEEIIPSLLTNKSKPIFQEFKADKEMKIKQMRDALLGQGKVHAKLYNQYKRRQFSKLESSLEMQNKRKLESHPNIYGNPEYLTKYVSFFDRLQYEVTKKALKDKYYSSITNLQSLSQNYFKPNLQKSKRSFKMNSIIKPNYSIFKSLNKSVEIKTQKPLVKKNVILSKTHSKKVKYTKGLNKTFDQTLNSSINSLDKSFSLMRQNQERFVRRIGNLLSQKGLFTMDSLKINSLNEKQFEVLVPLLHKMEKFDGKITVYQFQEKLHKFFKDLPTTQKHDIRHQQIRLQRKSQEKLKSSKVQQTHRTANDITKKKLHNKYYQKMENFV